MKGFRRALVAAILGGICGCASIDSVNPKERMAALSRIDDPVELAELARKSPYDDVRNGAITRISDVKILSRLSLEKNLRLDSRKLAASTLVALPGCEEACKDVFVSADENWLMLAVLPGLSEPTRAARVVAERIAALWKSTDLSIDESAEVYLKMVSGDLSSRQDQLKLARIITASAAWERAFEKVSASRGIRDQTVLLDLALERFGGERRVADWAICCLDDSGLKEVVRQHKTAEVRRNALNSVKGSAALSELSLDKKLALELREMAASRLVADEKAESERKGVLSKTDEYWLAWKMVRSLSASARAESGVRDRMLRWWRSAAISADERSELYLQMVNQDLSGAQDQRLMAEMLSSAKAWERAFARIKADNALVSKKELLELARGGYKVSEIVALWAVDKLGDGELLVVARESQTQKVAFKAVCCLKERNSIECVATGGFGTVIRLEAVNRLGKESEATLRAIAVSSDPNFRKIALAKMKQLGLSVESAQKAEEAVSERERAARAAADAAENARREAALATARKAVELAKIDGTIRTYRDRLNSGSLTAENALAFEGRIVSIASKNWRPKIRVEIRGAKETLFAICQVSGKPSEALNVGDAVSVSGKFKKGTSAEVVLSDGSAVSAAKGGGR